MHLHLLKKKNKTIFTLIGIRILFKKNNSFFLLCWQKYYKVENITYGRQAPKATWRPTRAQGGSSPKGPWAPHEGAWRPTRAPGRPTRAPGAPRGRPTRAPGASRGRLAPPNGACATHAGAWRPTRAPVRPTREPGAPQQTYHKISSYHKIHKCKTLP